MHDIIKSSIIPVITVVLGFALTFTRLETRFEESEKRATQRYYMLKEIMAQGNRTELAVAILTKDVEANGNRLNRIEEYVPDRITNMEQQLTLIRGRK